MATLGAGMYRRICGLIGLALMAGTVATAAPPAVAATTWDYANATFSISEAGGATPATVTVETLSVSGGVARGTVSVKGGAQQGYTCRTRAFSGLTATWTVDSGNPCAGTATFSVSPKGVLTLTDSAFTIQSYLYNGAGSGSASPLAPTPGSFGPCQLVTNTTTQSLDVTWADQPDAADYTVSFPAIPGASVSASSQTSVGLPLSLAPTGTEVTALVTANRADGKPVATCTTNSQWTAPAAPSIVGAPVIVAAGGLATINYALPNPTGVQGIQYQLDGGPWLLPGGVATINGAGGAFTLRDLKSGDHIVTIRTVGSDAGGRLTTAGSPVSFKIPPSNSQPPRPSAPVAIGSSASNPVPIPPANPVSTVTGISNGADSGRNGALAATTGDSGIDAPCLAQDGTLYPNQYSTVGSQLTMAPNTRGLGAAKAFTVIEGALAPGMQLDRTYGVLFGVPTVSGSWVTTVQALFADGTKKSSQFTTRIDPDPQTLQYAAQNIGSVGSAISITPTTNAPSVGTTYTLVCGELPAGLRFDPRTGSILGKPTAVVARPTPLRVAERSSSGTASASFILVINKAGTVAFHYPAHPHARVGSRIAIRPTVVGVGEIAQYRMWKGKLPRGLQLNRVTGVISGRIAHRGPTHTITVVAVTRGGALITSAPMRLRLTR